MVVPHDSFHLRLSSAIGSTAGAIPLGFSSGGSVDLVPILAMHYSR